MILSAPFSCDMRQDDVFAGHRFGHEFDDGGGDGDFGEVDELHAVEFGEGAHDLIGVGVSELDEGVVELGAGLLADALGLGELIGAENLAADEDVGEVAACFGHERMPPKSSVEDAT